MIGLPYLSASIFTVNHGQKNFSKVAMTAPFCQSFTALSEDIDDLGHVNNTVWLKWVQDIATAHWKSAGRPADIDRFLWVVVRHEIDYRGNIGEGESVNGETWIESRVRGAKSDRRVDFKNSEHQIIVSARTTWAMLERDSKRLVRIKPEIVLPFQRIEDQYR